MTVEQFVALIDKLHLRFECRQILNQTVWTVHCADGEPLYIFDKGYKLAQRRTLTELFTLAKNVHRGYIEGRQLVDDDPYADRRTSRPIKVLI